MTDPAAIPGERICSFIERVERIDEEIKALNEGRPLAARPFPGMRTPQRRISIYRIEWASGSMLMWNLIWRPFAVAV
jgi:hypothetical protein